MSDETLSGKVAIVTGGTRGLGRAIATGLAARGATVVVAARDEERCVAAAADMARETGGTLVGASCHVGRWEECNALVDRVVTQHGRLDILVNNAGMSPVYHDLDSVTEDYFDKVLAVNLKGPFRLSVRAAAAMGEAGAIVNISSIAAVRPRAHQIPYALAKAGLNTLTVALAHACGPAVRVNAVMAGPFLTDASAGWDMEAFRQRAEREIPLRRAGDPAEIFGAVAYLVGDDSGYTTGAVLKVDGGEAWAPA